MNFKIEVEGIDDVFKSLSDLESGESKTSFVAWTNRIELLAKQFCGDQKSHIKFKHTAKMGADFQFKDKHAIDCGIKSNRAIKGSDACFF